MLHLDDRLARSGLVREIRALTDDAVEADHLEPLEPALGERPIRRLRRQRERRRALLELDAALLERAVVDRLAVPEEDVEGDEGRRRLLREPADARLRGMEPHLHGVEVERALALDHDLAVERGVRRKQVADRAKLREVAKERPAIAAPERDVAAVVLEHAAEAIPLRLVAPAVAGRQLVDELRLHRRERHVQAGCVHPTSLGRTSGLWSWRCPSC